MSRALDRHPQHFLQRDFAQVKVERITPLLTDLQQIIDQTAELVHLPFNDAAQVARGAIFQSAAAEHLQRAADWRQGGPQLMQKSLEEAVSRDQLGAQGLLAALVCIDTGERCDPGARLPVRFRNLRASLDEPTECAAAH